MAMASQDGADSDLDDASHRDRPWLLPYNRRLRHLQGITIRNLSFTQPTSQHRGHSIDDDALPSALKSPTKTLAQRETRKLEHARSASDLRPISEVVAHAEEAKTGGSPLRKARPAHGRLRRRSTMEWSGASPLVRQKKLEDVAGSRMADTFFSLHVPDVEEPIYVSEMVEKAMNPNFRFFDLTSCGPSVTRMENLTVKLWTKTEHMQDFQLLVELSCSFRSLQFLGKALERYHQALPPNCIIFHLADGVYAAFSDTVSNEMSRSSTEPSAKSSSGRTLPTSSYDSLMRLSTLDDCIQDALTTRSKLEAQITAILEENKQSLSVVDQVPEAEESANNVETAVATQKKRLEAARRKRDELRANIHQRKSSMEKGRVVQARAQEDVKCASETLKKSQDMVYQTAEDIAGQRRRICEDLLAIYPIEPIPNRSLAFTIRGLPLPNSEFDDANEEMVAAALGHVAYVVHILQFYLSVPLPYPVQPNSSTSVVQDPISMTSGSRTYPLFIKGAVRFRFEYGVFLLNKDMEILSNRLGLKVLDIRQTLPNLKYLLYVATAGKGELPARKAGGIRGLLRGSTPSMSRTGSMDSNASGAAEEIRRIALEGHAATKMEGKNGKVVLGKGNLHRGVGMQSRLRDIS